MDLLLSIIISVLSGALVHVIYECMKDVYLQPLQQYKDIKFRISCALSLYANCLSNPVDLARSHDILPAHYQNGKNEFRLLAAELRAFIEIVS